MWSAEDPHEFAWTPLHSQKIGAWLAVWKRRIIVPIFFNQTKTAEVYYNQLLDLKKKWIYTYPINCQRSFSEKIKKTKEDFKEKAMSNLPYRLKQNDLKISFPKNITTASEKTDGLVH